MANTVELYANNAESTLAGAITNVALTLNVSPGSGVLFPNPNNALGQFFRLSLTDAATALQHEIVYVTAKTTDTFTILRGQEGTTAQAWSAGDICFNGWTAGAAANTAQQSQVQLGAANYTTDTGGAANTYAGVYTPANLGTIQDGVLIRLKIAHTNTGASTLTLNGGTSYPIWGTGGEVLTGGELVNGGIAVLLANTSGTAHYTLLSCEGGAQRTESGVVSSTRNGAMTISAASASGTYTADEIIVEQALGGLRICLASFNKTINLATTGAGGMDTGTAPASSFVGLYAIFNPVTGVSALLGQSANAVTLPEVYGGANMPAGYTASALLAVIPTNASSLMVPCVIMDRSLDFIGTSILSTATTAGSPQVINNLVVPLNARSFSGFLQISNTAGSSMSFSLLSSAANTAGQVCALSLTAAGSTANTFRNIKMALRQRTYYIAASSAGTPTFAATVSGYEI